MEKKVCRYCGAPLTGMNVKNSVTIYKHQGKILRSPITQECRDKKKCGKRQRARMRAEDAA